MENGETISRQEVIQAIEEGDRYAGIQLEEMNDKFTALIETYDAIDAKIDLVDINLQAFRREVDFKLNTAFDELRAMRKESDAKFEKIFQRFDNLETDLKK